MDARNMNFEDNKFDIVIDKGTFDALIVIKTLQSMKYRKLIHFTIFSFVLITNFKTEKKIREPQQSKEKITSLGI